MSRMLRIFCAINLILGLIPTSFALAADDFASPTNLAHDTSDTSNISDVPEPPHNTEPSHNTDPPNTDDPPETADLIDIPNDPQITPLDLLKKHLFIKSVNPGYKIDGTSETGEAIELANDSDTSLLLEGATINYINSSGNSYQIFEFPEGAQMIEKTILLRLDKSPEVKTAIEEEGGYQKVADAIYSKTLALTGSLELVHKESQTTIDSLCWTGKTGCAQKFDSAKPTTLVRINNPHSTESTQEDNYQHLSDYIPTFLNGLFLPTDPEGSSDEAATSSTEVIVPQCLDLEFSEILSYYEEESIEQFIEVFNPTDEKIPLKGCSLKYKNKLYDLIGTNSSTENHIQTEIEPTSFYVYRPKNFTLTKNPNTENSLELIDVTGDITTTMKYPHGQKKGTAYAIISNAWQTTYYPTPGAPNISQEFQTCPLGKVLNEQTGNCIKPTTLASVKPCPAGKYRSPETGRCRSIATAAKTQKPCKAGYERNPETGRCRKTKTNKGADYALVPITSSPEKTSFIAIWALIGLGVAGVIYVLFQFRREIYYNVRKFLQKLKK